MSAYACGLIGGLVAGFGAPIRVLRAPAELPGFAAAVYRIHTTATLAVFGTAVAVAGLWTSQIVVAGLVFAWGDTLLNYAQGHLTAVGRHLAANTVIVIHRLIPLLTVLVLWLTAGRVSFGALTLGLLIPAVIALVAPWNSVEQRIRPARRSVLGGAQLAYLGYSGAGVLSQLQTPVLQLASSASTVGAYAVANRVTGPITLLSTSLTGVLVPAMASRVGDPVALGVMHRRILAACAGYVALMVALAWPAGWVVAHLAGVQYHGVVLLVAACIIAAAISSASQGVNVRFLAVGRPSLATIPIVVGNVVGLFLLILIGRTDDVNLLGIAPIVAELVVLGLMLTTSKRRLNG